MAAQDLQRVKICLADIGRPVELAKTRVRGNGIIAPQKFLISHKLPDAGGHRVEQKKQGAIVENGEFDLLVDNDLSDLSKGFERPIDTVVAALPSRQHATVPEAQNEFTRDLSLSILWVYGDAHKWKI